MKQNARRFFFTVLVAGTIGVLSAAPGPAFAQAVAPEANRGAPHDWSHKHLLYTNPDTRDEAARKGTLAFERWKEKSRDPRFAAQVARKTRFSKAGDSKPFSPEQLQWARRFDRNPPAAGQAIQRDWSVALGTGGYGKPGVFPAKFSFDINATPDCTNDFVVFPTTGTGTTAGANGSFTGSPTAGQTVTITNPNTGKSVVLTASSSNNAGTNFLVGSASVSATNLAAAIVRNGAIVGVTEAGATRPTVTVTALDPGAGGNRITLADTLTNFTWGSSTLTGGGDPPTTRPTIVAFNNLYKDPTCAGTTSAGPPPYWSFNTGAAFTETSPVLSINGDQVALVQRGGTFGQASLVLLKWSGGSGTVASPTVPASQTAANYRSCTPLPCMLIIPFSNSARSNNSAPYHTNTNSSPFYDYSNDILYVGDDSGYLHKFTGIFNGTPAEVTTAPWPVAVSAGNELSSSVYDFASGKIFVGSASGATTGGSLHSIDSSGAVVTSGRLAMNNSTGIRDAPIVDSNAGRVYAFVGSNTGGTTRAAVYQFATNFTSGSTGANQRVGLGAATWTLYSGTFDDAYYTTPGTGHLYVCGSSTATARRPTLWQIPIDSSNVMGTPVTGPLLTGANANCSPVTEVKNNATDYVYVSVTNNASVVATGCTTGSATIGCIYVYDVTAGGFGSVTAGLAAPGGTSGVIVDNVSSTSGASQVYYSTLSSPGNAIQASQAALQ